MDWSPIAKQLPLKKISLTAHSDCTVGHPEEHRDFFDLESLDGKGEKVLVLARSIFDLKISIPTRYRRANLIEWRFEREAGPVTYFDVLIAARSDRVGSLSSTQKISQSI